MEARALVGLRQARRSLIAQPSDTQLSRPRHYETLQKPVRHIANDAIMPDDKSPRWYAIVDTAQDRSLYDLVQCCTEYQCLISGDVPYELATALPYLVQLDEGAPLTEAWPRDGLGKHWGVAFESSSSIDHLRLHFKRFLNAKLPDGTIALFRFYDPRVFRTYIRSATSEERELWFAGIDRFSVEGSDVGQLHDFELVNGHMYDRGELVGR